MPPGKVVKVNVLGIIHIQQLAGSVDKVMEGTGITFGCPGLGGQDRKGFVITALRCLHGTQQIPNLLSVACAGSWSKVRVLSYTEVWEVIAILSQSVP